MANFLRKLWEARLIENYNEVSVLNLMTTAPSEMTAEAVVFNKMGAGTINDYEGTVNWEDVDTSAVEMLFDFKKYFAAKVGDIDAAQAQPNMELIDAFAAKQSAEMSERVDAYAYAKYAAGAGTKITGKTISAAEDMYDYIVDLGVELGKKKVPVSNRYVVIGWDALGLLQKDKRFTHNPDVLANGIVNGQKINGMTIVVSANAPAGTIIALHKGAVGFGTQINELEGMRLQNAFADGVRGLTVAGAAVLNADGVATLAYTIAEG